MTAHWTDAYIGLPHVDLGRDRAGCDCYGLASLIYRDQLGINLPDYLDYVSTDERAEIAALIAGAASSPNWNAVETQAQVAPLDIVLFRRGRLTSHIGVVVSAGLMIHMAEAEHSRLEHYTTARWASRLIGHYRHVEAASRPVQ